MGLGEGPNLTKCCAWVFQAFGSNSHYHGSIKGTFMLLSVFSEMVTLPRLECMQNISCFQPLPFGHCCEVPFTILVRSGSGVKNKRMIGWIALCSSSCSEHHAPIGESLS